MRKRAVIGAAVTLAAALSAVLPATANAACSAPSCASTTITFGLSGGSLSISAPTTVDFSSSPFTPGVTSVTYQPTWPSGNNITVTDTRLVALGWTDTMSSLTTWTGAHSNSFSTLTSTFGLTCGTTNGLTSLATPALPLSTGGVLLTAVAPGNNSATCTGNLSIVVPPTAAADTYSGTITQTVA